MIAMLALVVDCANLSRCKALASAAASEGARYAAANPDKNDSEVESYVKGAIGLDGSCTVDIERGALSSKDVKLRVGDKSGGLFNRTQVRHGQCPDSMPSRIHPGRLRWSCGN